MEKNPVVRKGTWTKEEDILLRKCIEKYGEGKWHQVPLRAGLDRCRKSCRMRWMNYLKPNIKRGYFTKDEVDLIVRLHKLLGNRWSLIAGRLPGRTANDVKNFWNTYIVKSLGPAENSKKNFTKCNIIRPQPRTLAISKLQVPSCPNEVTKTNKPNDENLNNKSPSSTTSSSEDRATDDENPNNEQPSSSASLPQEERNDCANGGENPKNDQPISPSLLQEERDECFRWWSNLLEITETGVGFQEDNPILEQIFSRGSCVPANSHDDDLGSLSLDVDVFELLSFDL